MNKYDKKSNSEKGASSQQHEASPGKTPQQPKSSPVVTPRTPQASPAVSPQSAPVPLTSSPQPARAGVRPLSREFVLPNHEEIAKRAYQIYVEQGRPQGQSEQNWKQAEQEQRNKKSATQSSL